MRGLHSTIAIERGATGKLVADAIGHTSFERITIPHYLAPGTAVVQIGPRREEAKAISEEGITGAIVKDLKGVRKVCFVQGSGEHQL